MTIAMDNQSLAETSVHILASLFSGVLHGAGDRTANELYSVIARRLRARRSGEVLSEFEDSPDSGDSDEALVSALTEELGADDEFRANVREIVRRAVRESSATFIEQRTVSADRGSVAAGRDVDQSKKTNFGGITVGVVAIAVVFIVVIFVGRAIVLNVMDSGATNGGLSGDSTCTDYLASADMAAKAEVMKGLYLELGETDQAADPFIVQNTEYFCSSRPNMTLADLATT
jgi:hypothetical protein